MLSVVCQQSDLYEMVQIVGRGVTGRSSLPVLNNIYLEAGDDSLRLLSTDMEYLTIDGKIDAQVEEEGAITIGARILGEVAGALGEGDVHLETQTSEGGQANAVRISSGVASYSINALPADEFPVPPSVEEGTALSIPQNLLREVIQQTVFAASADETRPILTGALFSIKPEGLEVVATDTYRLVLRKVELETGIAQPCQAIVSARALNELARVLSPVSDEAVEVILSERQIEFRLPDLKLGSRLIEGEFPKYEKVIPTSHEKEILCEVSEQLQGDDIEIAFNARYILEMLGVCPSERVVIRLSGPLNPGIIVPDGRDDYIYVVMPMQIM